MKETGKSFLLVSLQFASIFYLAITGSILPANMTLLILLAMILIIGLWAVAEMKFRFNIFPQLLKNKQLVTSGPYSLIRHPMYSVIICVSLLWIINDFTILRFIVWIVLVAVLNLKLEYEEKILGETFKEYSPYKSRTKKLIPFIY